MVNEEDEYNDALGPSKSELKREMTALQELGEALMNLKPAELLRIPMTDALDRAIEESRRITSHEARRRHAQYIGKLMRGNDGEAIRTALQALLDPNRQRRLLHWLDRLDGCQSRQDAQPVLDEILNQYPDADRQHLLNLLRNFLATRLPEGTLPDAGQREGRKRERRRLSQYLNELDRSAPLY